MPEITLQMSLTAGDGAVTSLSIRQHRTRKIASTRLILGAITGTSPGKESHHDVILVTGRLLYESLQHRSRIAGRTWRGARKQ